MTEVLDNPMLEVLLFVVYLAAALTAGAHAVLNKRDPRAAWGWVAICWLFPLAGPLLYLLFGINRISLSELRGGIPMPAQVDETMLPKLVGVNPSEVRELVRVGEALTGQPLVSNNRIMPLYNGNQAYPAMLDAIAKAEHTVSLASYIFRDDEAGLQFAKALSSAQARGVTIRILLDGLADVAYRPRASRMLRKHSLQPTLFLPPKLLPPMIHINLRNHRKLLIVDDKVAYTGGMNISQDHYSSARPEESIQDVHFRVEGNLVHQLQAVFASDWQFATGENMPVVTSSPAPIGPGAVARVIRDGPNDALNSLELVLQAAFAAAHSRVWIMTPYLLPRPSMLASLQAAALRGLDVTILIPEHSDQPWIDWATEHLLWQLLQHHVTVKRRPAPFAHSKLILVDDYYLQFGTANLDTRSMRLNFELMVEVYDRPLVAELSRHFESASAESRLVTLEEVNSRSLGVRLRDGAFWMFSPFL